MVWVSALFGFASSGFALDRGSAPSSRSLAKIDSTSGASSAADFAEAPTSSTVTSTATMTVSVTVTASRPFSGITTVTDSVRVLEISSVLRVLVSGLKSSVIPRLSRTRLRSPRPVAGEFGAAFGAAFGASFCASSGLLCALVVGAELINTLSTLDVSKECASGTAEAI